MLQGRKDVGEFVASAQNAVLFPGPEIFASAQMEADLPRVLHALTVPEYMEAWVQAPDIERVECRSDPRSFDRFRIDFLGPGRRREGILGSCLLTKPNRVTYSWEDSSREGRRSLVEIRLWLHTARCTVKLRHSGLTRQDERDWYSRMWRDSLRKLCLLMEGSRIRAEQTSTIWELWHG